MTWKIKILNIKRANNDINLYVYFAIYNLNPDTNKFEEYYKKQSLIHSALLKDKSKSQKETFIKDFVKTIAQPLINTFQSYEDISNLIGYEEIL